MKHYFCKQQLDISFFLGSKPIVLQSDSSVFVWTGVDARATHLYLRGI